MTISLWGRRAPAMPQASHVLVTINWLVAVYDSTITSNRREGLLSIESFVDSYFVHIPKSIGFAGFRLTCGVRSTVTYLSQHFIITCILKTTISFSNFSALFKMSRLITVATC